MCQLRHLYMQRLLACRISRVLAYELNDASPRVIRPLLPHHSLRQLGGATNDIEKVQLNHKVALHHVSHLILRHHQALPFCLGKIGRVVVLPEPEQFVRLYHPRSTYHFVHAVAMVSGLADNLHRAFGQKDYTVALLATLCQRLSYSQATRRKLRTGHYLIHLRPCETYKERQRLQQVAFMISCRHVLLVF